MLNMKIIQKTNIPGFVTITSSLTGEEHEVFVKAIICFSDYQVVLEGGQIIHTTEKRDVLRPKILQALREIQDELLIV